MTQLSSVTSKSVLSTLFGYIKWGRRHSSTRGRHRHSGTRGGQTSIWAYLTHTSRVKTPYPYVTLIVTFTLLGRNMLQAIQEHVVRLDRQIAKITYFNPYNVSGMDLADELLDIKDKRWRK